MDLFNLYAKISLDSSDYETGIEKASKSGESLASKLKSGLSTAGSIAAKGIGVIAGAATAAGGALLALEGVTEEYRIAQGKLNTAFEAAGMSSETAKEAYRGFYAILGDTDTATEASQLLAQLAENEEDVATWTKISAGVLGTYGDSLPIESLIEAANETAKVGKVTGTLADALNWAGLSEEAFNAQLAACSSESERNQLIMETLEAQYDEASEAFYRNNDALVEARENQTKLDESLAKVGQSVANVKNEFLKQFAPAISAAADQAAEFIANIDPQAIVEKVQMLVSAFQTLLPVIIGVTAATVAYKAAVAISGIIDAVTKATQGMTIAQAALNAVMNANPFVLVATLVAGLVAAIVTLWTTNDGFKDAVLNAWEAIKNTAEVVCTAVSNFFTSAWDKIREIWNNSAIKDYFSFIWETIKGIFSVAKAVLSGNFSDAWEAIKGIFSGWKAYFEGLWEDLKGVFSGVWEWFSGIGEDIVNGIKEGISNAWNGLKTFVTNLFDGLYDDVTDNEEIHSPSKKWARIGQADALGLGEGWLDTLAQVKSQIQNDLDFGTSFMSMGQARPAFSYGYGAYPNNFANSSTANTESINITLELDGAVLARKMYTYNRTESKRRGTSLING